MEPAILDVGPPSWNVSISREIEAGTDGSANGNVIGGVARVSELAGME